MRELHMGKQYADKFGYEPPLCICSGTLLVMSQTVTKMTPWLHFTWNMTRSVRSEITLQGDASCIVPLLLRMVITVESAMLLFMATHRCAIVADLPQRTIACGDHLYKIVCSSGPDATWGVLRKLKQPRRVKLWECLVCDSVFLCHRYCLHKGCSSSCRASVHCHVYMMLVR